MNHEGGRQALASALPCALHIDFEALFATVCFFGCPLLTVFVDRSPEHVQALCAGAERWQCVVARIDLPFVEEQVDPNTTFDEDEDVAAEEEEDESAAQVVMRRTLSSCRIIPCLPSSPATTTSCPSKKKKKKRKGKRSAAADAANTVAPLMNEQSSSSLWVLEITPPASVKAKPLVSWN